MYPKISFTAKEKRKARPLKNVKCFKYEAGPLSGRDKRDLSQGFTHLLMCITDHEWK